MNAKSEALGRRRRAKGKREANVQSLGVGRPLCYQTFFHLLICLLAGVRRDIFARELRVIYVRKPHSSNTIPFRISVLLRRKMLTVSVELHLRHRQTTNKRTDTRDRIWCVLVLNVTSDSDILTILLTIN